MKKRIVTIGILLVAFIIAGVIMFNYDREGIIEEGPYAGYGNIEEANVWLVTDTHYIAPSLTDGGEYFHRMVDNGDGKYMYACEEINDAFVARAIKEKPDAIIVSGDLTFNGAYESHVAFAEKLQEIKDAGIQVIAIQGNHDFTEKRAAKFVEDTYELVDSIDATQYLDIYGDFGIDDAIARDETSLSYVAEIRPNLRVLVVDVNTVRGMPGILTSSTLDFAEKQLKKAQDDKAYVIGVTHQNLLEHSELTSYGMMFINNDRLLELYKSYNVLLNLSGHMHIQHIKESENGFVEIATGALMTAPNYYGKLTFKKHGLSYEAVPVLDEDSETAKAAHKFLWSNAYRQGSALVEGNIDQDDLATYFADFNTNYIAGRPDLIKWDSDLDAKWEKTNTFVPTYLKVVKDEMDATGGSDFVHYDKTW